MTTNLGLAKYMLPTGTFFILKEKIQRQLENMPSDVKGIESHALIF